MKINVLDHLEQLGKSATDRVTGFSGVVVSISFDLYGCVSALLHPGMDEKNGMKEQLWFDISRIRSGGTPVMPPPDFLVGDIAEGKKGPAEKPPSGKA